jgi:uncharacterized protein DUF3800
VYLMYVDESGDPGLIASPTTHFILSGLVVHESRWNACLAQLVAFRQRMRANHGLLMREEIHAAHFINKPGALIRMKRNTRLSILRFFADELAGMNDFRIINIVVDKRGKAAGYPVFETAWKALLQRFENTMLYRNFPPAVNAKDWGLILPDQTDVKQLTQLLRKMRRFNPIPNQPQHGPGYRNLLVSQIVEDPYFKRSDHSYFIQSCDLAAYLLYQEIRPSMYMRRKGGHRYFQRLDPILCKQASSSDPRGIVRL